MDQTGKQFWLDHSTKSDRFFVEAISEYYLMLSIGMDGLRLAVVNPNTQECLFVEHYQFYTNLEKENLIFCLNELFDKHLFLKASYWKSIEINLRGECFTIVPNQYFVPKNPEKYLKSVTALSNEHHYFFCEQPSLQAKNVFLAQKSLIDWLTTSVYPNTTLRFSNQSSAFVEGVSKNLDSTMQSQLHLMIEQKYFVAILYRNNQMVICNSYPYKSSYDFIYFVLFILSEMEVNTAQLTAFLYGKIEKESEIYELLFKYIQDVHIPQKLNFSLHFNQGFEKIPLFQFLDLLSIHLIYKDLELA